MDGKGSRSTRAVTPGTQAGRRRFPLVSPAGHGPCLAPLIRAEIWRCLAELRARRQAILIIDKNVDALARLADRHYMIEKGRVVWAGDSAALRADEAARHRYLGVSRA